MTASYASGQTNASSAVNGGDRRADDKASVYPGHRVLAMFPVYNEQDKLPDLLRKCESGLVDEFVAVNDGSTDRSPEILRERGITVLDQAHLGLGACIKRAVRFGRQNGFTVMVVMAGNNKDDPREIPRLITPIIQGGMDYVQGSRFLPGGAAPNTPLFRWFTIRTLSGIFSVYMGRRCTDLTNGFRAYRLDLFDDRRINIDQSWLDNYEYEYYVHWKAYSLRYRVTEAPVTKAYPADRNVKYTKIKPFTGWWRMLRPFFLLGFGLKN